jgi:hypothetical protein
MEIVKMGYSVDPWRLVDSKGRQIQCLKSIVTDEGDPMSYIGTISGKTKGECTQAALNYLETILDVLERKAKK